MLVALDAKMERQEENQRRMFASQDTKFDQILKNHASSIHNLEVQVGQLANALSSRSAGTLPSNTESNPREQMKAIKVIYGQALEEPGAKEKDDGENGQDEKEKQEEERRYIPPPPYQPRLPYPQRVHSNPTNARVSKFFAKVKKLSSMDAMLNMTKYAKFLPDILNTKPTWEDNETIALTERSSSHVTNPMPSKLQDSGSFTIPCVVGDLTFSSCLCDLGASVNLIPLSVFRRLGIGEVKPTSMLIQLADQTVRKPYGVVEDVPVKVDKYFFPVDFVVLDFEEDKSCPLIFGRPFMNTSRAVIDVHKGLLIFRIGDERVVFNMSKMRTNPVRNNTCMKVEVVDKCGEGTNMKHDDPMESQRSAEVSEMKERGEKLKQEADISFSLVTPPILRQQSLSLKLGQASVGKKESLPMHNLYQSILGQEERIRKARKKEPSAKLRLFSFKFKFRGGRSFEVGHMSMHEEGGENVLKRTRLKVVGHHGMLNLEDFHRKPSKGVISSLSLSPC